MSIKKNVAFIGLGTMGYPMAGHLSKSNLFNLKVFNRSSQRLLYGVRSMRVRFPAQLKRQ